MTVLAAIALGSNLGDRAAHLHAAIDALGATRGIDVLRVSRVIETDPVGPVAQGRFLNACAVMRTSLSPRELLEACLAVESSRGRDRAAATRWGPRPLDLDILLVDQRRIDEPGLVIPHPRLHERLFVLEPLAEIAPDWVVPTLRRSVRDLLESLRARHAPRR